MGKAWHDASPASREIFARANNTLGYDLATLCFEGPADELNRTDRSQPAIYTASVACYEGLRERGSIGGDGGGGIGRVVATAGLSLGEFTALHLAGAFDFETGLKLVQLRGSAMQQAAQATVGGMVALIGGDEAQATQVCDEARGDDVLVCANFNAPGQIVISGSSAACDRAIKSAQDLGLRATALTVAGAFHSPLMAQASERLGEALADVAWSTPAVTVMSNVTALPHDANDTASIRTRLIEQLTHAVRWSDSMAWMVKNVPGNYLEMAPGKTLAGLMRRIDRGTKVANHAEPA